MFDVETYAIIKKRIASVIGGSTNGSTINDAEISEDTMLSSQKIVDTVCPPFSVSGSIVQCTPVENYELGVKVDITPIQEGNGDPSPENVRPIAGWEAVNIHQSNGDQDKTYPVQLGQTVYGGTLDVGTGELTSLFNYFESSNLLIGVNTPSDANDWVSCYWVNQLSTGNRKPLTEIFCNIFPAYRWNGGLQNDVFVWWDNSTFGIAGNINIFGVNGGEDNSTVLQKVNSFLSNLSSFQIFYELEYPQVKKVNSKEIFALSGTNTLYANVGDITVTGVSDPGAAIATLQDRLTALENNTLN